MTWFPDTAGSCSSPHFKIRAKVLDNLEHAFSVSPQ